MRSRDHSTKPFESKICWRSSTSNGFFRICSWLNCPVKELCIRVCAFLLWGILFICHMFLFFSIYAYLPKQPRNIGHIYYCQVHVCPFLGGINQKTLHHNHCRAMKYLYIYTHLFLHHHISHLGKSASLPSLPWNPGFPGIPGKPTHRGAIITLRIWWLPSMWPPAPKEGTNHEFLMGGCPDGYRDGWGIETEKNSPNFFGKLRMKWMFFFGIVLYIYLYLYMYIYWYKYTYRIRQYVLICLSCDLHIHVEIHMHTFFIFIYI